MVNVYGSSINHLEKALEIIPTGSQTFSKSYYSLPRGGAPLYADRAQGPFLWDIDGNKYIDLVNGLLSVSLGYQDRDVNRAINEQLSNGINFSLPHKLEFELAQRLVEIIPCAEMVRFGKNGTDVTSAAIRIARAYTGREHVAVCGYHGWQDWYIGSTSRSKGVPSQVKSLTHPFKYNDFESLVSLYDSYPDLAAVIIEPLGAEYPTDNFLERLREFCTKKGIVLIFDEMITGFRVHLGGAQSHLSVIPDLATFGKGMANGMPISAIVGNRELMSVMDEIFFSGTFGGEALSIAAAIATIDKMKSEPVIPHLHEMGSIIKKELNKTTSELGIDWLSIIGHSSWGIINIVSNDYDPLLLKTVLIEQLCKRGVLTIGSHNVSYATKKDQVHEINAAYGEALDEISLAIKADRLSEIVVGEPLEAIFKVR